MKIAVDTGALVREQPDGRAIFLYEVLKRIVLLHPGHDFIFLSPVALPLRRLKGNNITYLTIPAPPVHLLLRKWWYDIRLTRLLRKIRADVFVSGNEWCSFTTPVPQCVIVPDLSFLQVTAGIRSSRFYFYRKYLPRFLAKAGAIITLSTSAKEEITKQYPGSEGRIKVVYKGANTIFHPAMATDHEMTRARYCEGKNYFLYAGPLHPRKNLVNLLKAFSIFKKRQKSDWKLVLAGSGRGQQGFMDSLASYKYRADLVLTGYLEEEKLAALMGSAYALVYPSRWEGFGVTVLEAMQSGVPVVSVAGSAMQEIAGDAALYADPGSHTDIADKLMLLYKDEALRGRLIGNGKLRAAQYSWERTSALFWEGVETAASGIRIG